MRKAENFDSAIGLLAHIIGLVADREPYKEIERQLYVLRERLRRIRGEQTKHG